MVNLGLKMMIMLESSGVNKVVEGSQDTPQHFHLMKKPTNILPKKTREMMEMEQGILV
jgi:hypothetical protein